MRRMLGSVPGMLRALPAWSPVSTPLPRSLPLFPLSAAPSSSSSLCPAPLAVAAGGGCSPSAPKSPSLGGLQGWQGSAGAMPPALRGHQDALRGHRDAARSRSLGRGDRAQRTALIPRTERGVSMAIARGSFRRAWPSRCDPSATQCRSAAGGHRARRSLQPVRVGPHPGPHRGCGLPWGALPFPVAQHPPAPFSGARCGGDRVKLQELPQPGGREGWFTKIREYLQLCIRSRAAGIRHPPAPGAEGLGPPTAGHGTPVCAPLQAWIPTRSGVIQPHSFRVAPAALSDTKASP